MVSIPDTTPAQLARNLTPEVRGYMETRMVKLTDAAVNWPVKVAVSHIGKGHPTHDPGTRVVHLLCWLPGQVNHCGQAVCILALGQAFYQVTSEDILRGIRLHIDRCHSEEVYNGTP
jgi:hypothetical protein